MNHLSAIQRFPLHDTEGGGEGWRVQTPGEEQVPGFLAYPIWLARDGSKIRNLLPESWVSTGLFSCGFGPTIQCSLCQPMQNTERGKNYSEESAVGGSDSV